MGDETLTAQNGDNTAKPTSIGPYKILEEIGEGGMGVVYHAEQTRPFRRRVALKVVKPGMDSGAVITRFESERQALALMDRPGVAKVFDAGTTGQGRPYFVMEHVAGIPITEHCDRHKDFLLQENGYFLLRFLAEDVGKHLDEVLDAILRTLSHRRRVQS